MLEEDLRERDEEQRNDCEHNVVAVQEIVRLVCGVAEPEGLKECERPAKGGLCIRDGGVREHWFAGDAVDCSWRVEISG